MARSKVNLAAKKRSGAVYKTIKTKDEQGNDIEIKEKVEKKSRRARPGTKALREIRFYQNKHHENLIPKTSFQRLVREITQELGQEEIRFQPSALLALQCESEKFLTELFEDSNTLALNSKRVSIQKKDLKVAFKMLKKHLSFT